MNDRRHRERTIIENDSPGSPPPASARPRDATIVEPSPQQPYPGQAPYPPQQGYPPPQPGPAWPQHGAPPQGYPQGHPQGSAQGAPPFGQPQAPANATAPRRPRDSTVYMEADAAPAIIPVAPGAPPSAAPATSPNRTRRIAGWLLSEDGYTCHILRSGSNLVGRAPEQDVIVDDPSVSGLQCNIICEIDATLLMPKPEARNPTAINGRRTYTTDAIPPFATISFGSSSFVFVPVPSRLAPPQPPVPGQS